MAMYPQSSTLVTSPTCHLVAAQIPKSLSGKLSSTSKVDCLANTSATLSNTNQVIRSSSVASLRSDAISKSNATFILPSSSYLDSTTSPLVSRVTKDVMGLSTEATPFRMSQISEVDLCLVEPTGRSKRVRKLTPKALELHHDTSSRYYISSDINVDSKKSQARAAPTLLDICTSSDEPLTGSKRKRDTIMKSEAFCPSVRRIKQEHEHQSKSQEQLTQRMPAFSESVAPKENSIIHQNDTDGSPDSKCSVETLEGKSQSSSKSEPSKEEAKSPCGQEDKVPDITPTRRRRSTRLTNLVATQTAIQDTFDRTGSVAVSMNDSTAEGRASSVKKELKAQASLENEQKCFKQGISQASVSNNISFVTIRLPSTQLSRFKSAGSSSQDRKTTVSKSFPVNNKDSKLPESPTKLEFGEVKCQLSCLKSADPSLLLYALGKAMAQMDGEGAEDEMDEDFNLENFQRCMKEECICDGKQTSGKINKRVALKVRLTTGAACTAEHNASASKGKCSSSVDYGRINTSPDHAS